MPNFPDDGHIDLFPPPISTEVAFGFGPIFSNLGGLQGRPSHADRSEVALMSEQQNMLDALLRTSRSYQCLLSSPKSNRSILWCSLTSGRRRGLASISPAFNMETALPSSEPVSSPCYSVLDPHSQPNRPRRSSLRLQRPPPRRIQGVQHRPRAGAPRKGTLHRLDADQLHDGRPGEADPGGGAERGDADVRLRGLRVRERRAAAGRGHRAAASGR